MRTQIHYCRKADGRGYQVVDISGRVLAQFGTGSYEKYRAERFQLQMEHPQVLRLADRITKEYPELPKRALRAATLYVEGHVHLNGAEHVYGVDSQSGGGQYLVHLQFSSCSCPDWEGALSGRRYSTPWCEGKPACKHIVAALVFEMLNGG
jgi:hypothetical protein